MIQATRSTACGLAVGAVALLSFCAGCGDVFQSRANNGGSGKARIESVSAETEDTGDTGVTAGEVDVPSESAASRSTTTPTPAEPPVSGSNSSQSAPTPASGRKTTREITFDTLKFDIEKGGKFERSMLTPAIEKLDGQRVRIRGYMLPSFQQSGITQFVLVRDNMECCFGPGAALYDCVIVEMVDGESCSFSVRPIAVEGTFSIREFRGPDDMHLAIFHLDGERVR